MESFAVDLDRVLDEFERKEGALKVVTCSLEENCHPKENMCSHREIASSVIVDEFIDSKVLNSETESSYSKENDSIDSKEFNDRDKWRARKFDDENSTDAQEGYFVPEGPKRNICERSALDIQANKFEVNSSTSALVNNVEQVSEGPNLSLCIAGIDYKHICEKEIRPSFLSCSPSETTSAGNEDYLSGNTTSASKTLQLNVTNSHDAVSNYLGGSYSSLSSDAVMNETIDKEKESNDKNNINICMKREYLNCTDLHNEVMKAEIHREIQNIEGTKSNKESQYKTVNSDDAIISGGTSNSDTLETSLMCLSDSNKLPAKNILNEKDTNEVSERKEKCIPFIDGPKIIVGLSALDINVESHYDSNKNIDAMNEMNVLSNENTNLYNGMPKESHLGLTETVTSQGSLEIPAGLAPVPLSRVVSPPLSSSNPLYSITDLGKRNPSWIPDAETTSCMQCDIKFTFTKRRHHCRACGKIFCKTCCNLRSKLQYLENKEGRVCSRCYQDLIRAQVFERMESAANQSIECDSRIDGIDSDQQNYDSNDLSVIENSDKVMGPTGVLRKEGLVRKDARESKQVIFSDGIRPGRDYTDYYNSEIVLQKETKGEPDNKTVKCVNHFIPKDGLPPVLKCIGNDGEITKEDAADPQHTMDQIESCEETSPVHFVINNNLIVSVKLVNLDCCLNKVCLCFASKGLCTVGQSEIFIVLEWEKDQKILPMDVFKHFQFIYEEASIGNMVTNMDCTVFSQYDAINSNNASLNNKFLGSSDNGGFLYITPTFQCVNKLLLPEQPYLCAILLQKWELPWAKVFPLRLMLRLGAEFRYYPCPLISIMHRKPVFSEIGHTIMNLLIDFRNYQYTIPMVHGFTIEMKAKKTFLNFPRNSYQEVTKVLSNGNEHVIAIGANFSEFADSYLVCIQNQEGNYQTQAINIQNAERKVTGASFVVFNGALKTKNMDICAKSTIVEDGLMIHVLPEVILRVRDALTNMKDLVIPCGSSCLEESNSKEEVAIHWVDEDKNFNVGEKSPIDGLSLEGIENVHIHNVEYNIGPRNKAVRWVKVFFLETKEDHSRLEPVDLSRFAETLAKGACVALAPLSDNLYKANLKKIGLRATINNETVGYQVGSMGQILPDACLKNLDNELVPVIHNAASQNRHCMVELELIFYIVNK